VPWLLRLRLADHPGVDRFLPVFDQALVMPGRFRMPRWSSVCVLHQRAYSRSR
jgi:hypothetical protein